MEENQIPAPQQALTQPPSEHRFRLVQGALVLALFGCATFLAHTTQAVAPPEALPAAAARAEPQLTAISAYVLDVATGEILYAKNADAQLPIASITKLFTVATAYEALSPESVVRVSLDAVMRGEGGLGEGEEWLMRDLADYTLIVSSNVGAEALAEAASPRFRNGAERPAIERMNQLARELGLERTYFLNASGLDVSETQASAMSSARDLAHFLRYLYGKTELFSGTLNPTGEYKPLNAETLYAKNTNDAIPDIPGLIFGKTGFTDLAGGTLAVLFEMGPARPVAIVVLGSTREARFSDVRALIRYISPSK